MSPGRQEAIRTVDYPKQLAYLDAFLDEFPGNGAKMNFADEVERRRMSLRGDRQYVFRKLVDSEVETIRKVEDPAVRLQKLLALRRFGRAAEPDHKEGPSPRQEDFAPTDKAELQSAIDGAATDRWRAVEALETAGDLPGAIMLGQSIVDEVTPEDSHVAMLAALMKKGADQHVKLAESAASLPGAFVLHYLIAKQFGATPPEGTLGPFSQATGLSYEITVDNPCTNTLERLTEYLPGKGGAPITLAVKYTSCEVVSVPKGSTQEDMHYKETVKKTVAKETWSDSICSEKGGYPSLVEVGGGTNKHYEVQRPTMTVCSTPTKGFHGATEEIEVLEDRVETVEVQHRTLETRAQGTLVVTFDGATREVPFSLTVASSDDTQYKGAHVEPKAFNDEGLKLEASAFFHRKLAAVITDTIAKPIQDERTRRALERARTAAAAGNALEAVDGFVIASVIQQKVEPELVALMEKAHHVPQPLVEAALYAKPLPRIDLVGSEKYVLPAVDRKEYAEELRLILDDGTNVAFQSKLMLTAGVGPSFASGAMTDSNLGIVGQMSVGVILPRSRYTSYGFGFRLGGGAGAHKSSIVDFDLFAAAGLHWGDFSLLPLVGLGLDATPGYESDTADPEGLGVPPGAYFEYGLLARYPIGSLGLEAMYTKAARTASAMSFETRVDARLTYARKSLVARFAEYRADDGFLQPFSAADRAGKTLWLLVGLGF